VLLRRLLDPVFNKLLKILSLKQRPLAFVDHFAVAWAVSSFKDVVLWLLKNKPF
jgi:hypothetical protein